MKSRSYHKFSPLPAGSIMPLDGTLEFLRRQQAGLSGNYTASGYPFDTPMWAGGVGEIRIAALVHNDPESKLQNQDAWWPYEQSAYLLDGMVKLGILLGDADKIALFERNLRYLVDHPGKDGRLGKVYNCDMMWPMAVFFRAVAAYVEYKHDESVIEAFHRHYLAVPVEEIGIEFRHICSLEGLLTVYGWTGDEKLLAKAEEAYRLHDRYYSLHTEIESELNFGRLRSGEYVIHGVTWCEELKLPVQLYLYTGKREYLDVACAALDETLRRHEQIPGLPSCNEDLAGRDPLQGYETCVIHDFLWTLRQLLAATGDAAYADRIEKVVYNALPGAVTEDFTRLLYLSGANQVVVAPESNHSFFLRGSSDTRQLRTDFSAQCCPGNLHHIMPDFVMGMFMLDPDGAPVATLYGGAVMSGEYRGTHYRIASRTSYPNGERIYFKFLCEKPLEMPFSLRIPGWCALPDQLFDAATVTVNGGHETLPRLDRAGFVTIRRCWQDGDLVELTLPFMVREKHDRNWMWYEAGPLVFALEIDSREVKENPSDRFSPAALYPESMWNYSPLGSKKPRLRLCFGRPEIEIEATRITGFDTLELGRFTPQVPLYGRRYGDTEYLTLVPYGEAMLRIAAFPDGVKRQPLFIYQALVSPRYPYDWRKPLRDQKFLPEEITPEELVKLSTEIVAERDGFYDLVRFFGRDGAEDKLAYVTLRFWADEDAEATFSVGATTTADYFVNGELKYSGRSGFDAQFMAGEWFTSPVKKGFNTLVVKAAKGFHYWQLRDGWGVRADIFTVTDDQEPQEEEEEEQ